MNRSPDQKSNTALQLIKIPQKNESFVIFKLDMLLIG
jgi:hypothetical protein